MQFKGKVSEPDRVIEYVYDPKSEMVIAAIQNGIYETKDPKVIEALKRLKYEVIENPPEASDGELQVETEEKLNRDIITKAVIDDNLDSIKVNDLLEFAKVNKIDLGDAKKKVDIVKVILEAE